MTASAFSYQVRVLLCPQCGAPIEVSPAGGATPCRFCGAHAQVSVRDDSLDAVLRPQRAPMSEGERLARLRPQAGKALVPPGNIRHLFDGGSLAPYRQTEAIDFWRGACRESLANGQPEVGETVYYLAMALSSLYGDQNDAARQRAVLESSLEALRLPRHRQALRCMLSRLACHSGDPAAAEQWLAPCDPASDDIEVDSPYRFSRAVLATAHQDWNGVVAVLGRTVNDVPILGAMDSTCLVFRANAIEKLGDVQAATAMLSQHTTNRPDHATRLDKTFEYWAPFGLCAASRAPAQAVRQEQKARTAGASGGGSVGTVFAVLGSIMGVVGVGLLITALVVSRGSSSGAPVAAHHAKGMHAPPQPAPSVNTTAVVMPFAMPGGILTLMGIIFSAVGFPLQRAAAKARRIALTGERAQAQVQGSQPTGLAINNVPQYALTLLVQRAGGAPPYVATVKVLGARAVAGMTVPVMIDPQDPSSVILDQG